MKIIYTKTFFDDLEDLPKAIRTKCRRLWEELDKTPRDRLVSGKMRGWRLHKLESSPFTSLSVDMNYRVLANLEGDRLTLHRVVKHDLADSAWVNRNDRESAVGELSQTELPEELRGRVVQDLNLGRTIQADKRRFLCLDEKQLRCIDDFLVHNGRALVSGRPGTGKTLIAAEAARRLRNEGKRVVVVCFTEALARWLRSELAGNGLEVWAIKRLAIALLELAGRTVRVPVRREDWTAEFWRSVVPRALCEAGDAIQSFDFDAIIVDEGQDLDPDDWRLIECLAEQSECLWVFHDPSQRLWSDRRITVREFAKYSLRRQYRCHETIQALAHLYQSEGEPNGGERRDAASAEGMGERRIAVIPCSTRVELQGVIVREIDSLLAHGLDRGAIAVISLVSRTDRGAIAGLHKIEKHTLSRADDDGMRGQVVADSVYRFKGLERPAVILTDLSLRGPEDAMIRRAKMNVAITRAQSFLRIIDTKEALSKEPELTGFLR